MGVIMKVSAFIAAAAAAAFAITSPAAAGVLTGKTLQLTYLYPDSSTVYTGPYDVTGGGPGVTFFIGSNQTVTLGGDTITLSDDCPVTCAYNNTTFNGIRLFDAYNQLAPFTSATLVSSDFAGFTPSRITFDANNIYVNMEGLVFDTTPSGVVLQVTAGGGVPEPATWALMIGGFGLAGAALRRRKAMQPA